MAKILDIGNFWNPAPGRPIDAAKYGNDIRMLVEAINNSISEEEKRVTSVNTWSEFVTAYSNPKNFGKMYFIKNSGGANGMQGIGQTEPVFAYVISSTSYKIIKTWEEMLKVIPTLDVSNLHPDQIISGIEAHISDDSHIASVLGITSEMLEGLRLLKPDVVNKIKALDTTDLVHRHELDVDKNTLDALKQDVITLKKRIGITEGSK